MKIQIISMAIVSSLLLLLACGKNPERINYGEDECELCRMRIMDNQYGAEIVSDKGKIYKFDSVECLINFSLQKNTIGDENQTFLISDYSNPGVFVEANKTFFVHNDNFSSPMGLNVSGFKHERDAENFISQNGGDKLSWMSVIELTKKNNM